MKTTRIAFVAAPALRGALRSRTPDRPPEPLRLDVRPPAHGGRSVLFALVIAALRRMTPGRGATFAGIGLIGIVTLLVQFGIDIVVGLLAEDGGTSSAL